MSVVATVVMIGADVAVFVMLLGGVDCVAFVIVVDVATVVGVIVVQLCIVPRSLFPTPPRRFGWPGGLRGAIRRPPQGAACEIFNQLRHTSNGNSQFTSPTSQSSTSHSYLFNPQSSDHLAHLLHTWNVPKTFQNFMH